MAVAYLLKRAAAIPKFKEMFSFFANHLVVACAMQREGRLVRR